MFYNHKFIPIFMVLTLMFNTAFNVVFGQNKPFPQALNFPNTIKPNNVSQSAMNNSVTTFYEYWKSAYLKQSNGNTSGGYFVYVSVTPGTKTVSEAHGYGMIITVLLAGYDPAAKEYFDGMYFMYKNHQSTIDPDLMSWVISNDEDPAKDEDSATDGDMDIAYALLLAHDQWGSEGRINYIAEASRIISNGIKESNCNNNRLMLGDWWDNDWQWATRTSDWMPDHLRAYYNVTKNEYWIELANTIYSLINSLTNNYSPHTGLMPDFVDGQIPTPVQPDFLESEYDGVYNWNACRFPWRIAVDYAHYGTTNAKNILTKMINWIKNKTTNNPANINSGYMLTGEPIPDRDYSSLAFIAPFIAASIVNESNQQYLNAGWNIMSNSREETYFGDTINLLCSLLISGNWWKPEENNLNDVKNINATMVTTKPFLEQNYPNPFNQGTFIYYHLPRAVIVKISVFNIQGQKISTLVNSFQTMGDHKVNWRGIDESGRVVTSGVYYIQFTAGKLVEIKKMIVLK